MNANDRLAADLATTRPTCRAAWWAEVVLDGVKAAAMVGLAVGGMWATGVVRW